MSAVFPHLSEQQTRGLACIVCNTPYDTPPPIDHVPVGVAEDRVSQVFACAARCAPAVGYVPDGEQLELGAGR